jgi:hypothetical protein
VNRERDQRCRCCMHTPRPAAGPTLRRYAAARAAIQGLGHAQVWTRALAVLNPAAQNGRPRPGPSFRSDLTCPARTTQVAV